MKLWYSFVKELKLASRGFYFYIEIFMAVLLVLIMLFAVPENFGKEQEEYFHLDMSEEAANTILDELKDTNLISDAENVQIKVAGKEIEAELYTLEDEKIYIIPNKQDLISLADHERKIATVVEMDSDNNLNYKYYLQGYETERLKNLLLVSGTVDIEALASELDNQDVRPLGSDFAMLTDRENIIPAVLTFNGALMGLFIIAAYVFLDKKEGVIKAYAVTASSVWQYLMSKVGVVLFTSTLSSLILLIPVMGFKPNYLLLILLLITTGFFASSLGLLIASFYDNIMQAFGVIYLFMIVIMVPGIAYFIPGWSPIWVRILPSYPMMHGFKEILLSSGNVNYVLLISLGFLIAGAVLFALSNMRYKKTLTV